MISKVPAIEPMTIPATAPPERLLGQEVVEDPDVVDCLAKRVVSDWMIFFKLVTGTTLSRPRLSVSGT